VTPHKFIEKPNLWTQYANRIWQRLPSFKGKGDSVAELAKIVHQPKIELKFGRSTAMKGSTVVRLREGGLFAENIAPGATPMMKFRPDILKLSDWVCASLSVHLCHYRVNSGDFHRSPIAFRLLGDSGFHAASEHVKEKCKKEVLRQYVTGVTVMKSNDTRFHQPG
jgi:hypothetical protein